MTSRDERDALGHFEGRYAVPDSAVAAEIEQHVIGAVWGANGYTTLEQADELARRLALGPGRRLLDVGTGRGWPGLYVAVRYGSVVAGTDMPFDALMAASRRARAERADHNFSAVAAAGVHQPFPRQTFDAVVHTDVLC
jgi:2-polyprenyl-3-methyl-5-hydroxy-6-metoxy-1,4-benzoquinol methylase